MNFIPILSRLTLLTQETVEVLPQKRNQDMGEAEDVLERLTTNSLRTRYMFDKHQTLLCQPIADGDLLASNHSATDTPGPWPHAYSCANHHTRSLFHTWNSTKIPPAKTFFRLFDICVSTF